MNSSPPDIVCRACGQNRTLDDFRVFKADPLLYMDFCVSCERQHGTLVLYRRYSGYGTPEIAKAVYAANRAPKGKRTADQVRLLVEPKESTTEPKTKEDLLSYEIARRELCQRRLMFFITTFDPTYVPGWMHHDLARRLERFMERVERGESPRLMVFVPPRHGKSTEISDMAVSWMLGHHPEWDFIVASYGLELPLGFSRKIRDRLRDPEFQAIFENTRLRADSQGVEEWVTTRGGGFKAAGIGVGITGKGFKVGVLDDPIKDYEAAQSEPIRNAAWGWWQSTFRTRAAPGAGIIVVQTRWHDADVSGKLLEVEEVLRKEGVPEHELENWEVVSYPAIADNNEHLMSDGSICSGELPDNVVPLRLLRRKGEALHPERYSLSELKKIKNTSDPAIWNAMYQQNPTPADGEFFKKGDLRYQILDPEWVKVARLFMTVDYAIDKKTRNNFTVMGIHALTSNDDLYTLDIRRGRMGTLEIVTNAVEMVEQWKPEVYAGERGQIHAAVWPLIQAALDKKRLYITVDESLVPIQDKEARARPLQGRMQRGKHYFSYAARVKPTLLDQVERELLRFPNGVNDDIVDMLSWSARLALTLSLPEENKGPPKQESWTDKLKALTEQVDDHMAA